MYIQELLAFLGNETDHIAVRTSSYVGTEQKTEIKVHGLHYIVENANADDRVLIVDDIFESGRSIEKVVTELKKQMRNNFPKEVRVATLLAKDGKRKTDIVPNYYVEKTNQWIVFPHELEGLSLKEIATHRGFNPFAPLEPEEIDHVVVDAPFKDRLTKKCNCALPFRRDDEIDQRMENLQIDEQK
jgi:hypothetical protein